MSTNAWWITGAALVVIFLAGFWLNRSGKPYNGIILTIHKLVSLAVAVFLFVTAYRAAQGAGLGTMTLIAAIVSALLIVIQIISGGLLSMERQMPAAVATIHRIASVLAVLSTALTLYLLIIRS